MNKLLEWVEQIGLRHLIWATDLDSTLLDPQPKTHAFQTPQGLEDTCRLLNQKTGGAFIIITGREINYLDDVVFPHTRFCASAEYNNATRYTPDQEICYRNPIPDWSPIDDALDALANSYPGLLLRKKSFMRSLHFHQVPVYMRSSVKQHLKENLETSLDRLNCESGQHIELIDGGFIYDMAPVGSNKATALQDFIDYVTARDQAKRLPIYFGDSSGDLPAGRLAKSLGGVFVVVGRQAEEMTKEANFVLDDTEKCRAFFRRASKIPDLSITAAPLLVPQP